MTKLLDGSGRERLTEGFRKSADARKGFTLLELIVAATILMILTNLRCIVKWGSSRLSPF